MSALIVHSKLLSFNSIKESLLRNFLRSITGAASSHSLNFSRKEKVFRNIDRSITTRSRSAPSHGRYGPSVRILLNHYGINWHDVQPSGPYHFLLKSDVLKHIQRGALQPLKVKHAVHHPHHHHHHHHHQQQQHDHQQQQQLHMQPEVTEIQEKFNIPMQATAVEDLTNVKVNQFIKLPFKQDKIKLPDIQLPFFDGQPTFVDNELTSMRKVIAERLTYSKTHIPHAYMVNDCDFTRLIEYRKEMRSRGKKLSLNDFIIKASALTLRQVKQVNVEYNEENSKIIPHENVDISIAVAIKAGLITPIIKSANELTFEQISANVKQLVEKAHAGKLLPHEFQGGTFSISNLGMFGIKEFTAVINPPQAAILAVGGTKYLPSTRNLNKFRETVSLTLSYDMRAVTDENAAKFMDCLKSFLETPESMLLV